VKAMANHSASPADTQDFVLPHDVNSVILENLTAVAGPRTRALLDTVDTAGAGDALIALTVN
jgi:hypothetical protein